MFFEGCFAYIILLRYLFIKKGIPHPSSGYINHRCSGDVVILMINNIRLTNINIISFLSNLFEVDLV
jgi:hypothetical protein